jgi:transposase-like protein
MPKRTRIHYSGEFKAKVSMEAILQTKTLSELSSEYGVHTSQILKWKKEFKENAGSVFEGDKELKIQLQEKEERIEELYKQVGILTVEREYLKKKSKEFPL